MKNLTKKIAQIIFTTLYFLFFTNYAFSQQYAILINNTVYPIYSYNSFPCNSYNLNATCGTIQNGNFIANTSYFLEKPNGWSLNNPCNAFCNTHYLTTDFSSGGIIKFRMPVGGGSQTVDVEVNIYRPTNSYASISGDDLLCGGQSKTYSISNAQGTVTWSSSWNLNIQGGNQGNSVSVGYNGNAAGYITANFLQDNCPVQNYKNVHTGVPSINASINGSCYGYTLNLNSLGNQWNSWYSNPSDWGSYYSFGDYVDAHPYISGYTVVGTSYNQCGQAGYTWVLDACEGYYSYKVYPNPANDFIEIDFLKAEDKKYLPEKIELLNEKTSKPQISLNIYDLFDKKQIENGKLTLNVKELERGTYFIHTTFPDLGNLKGRVEKIKVVLQ